MAPIKVGIIGYGFSAKCFHLPFILPNPDLEVYAFLQRAEAPADPSQVKGWGHCTIDFPQAKHYRTSDEFFADPDVELIIICTHTHDEFIEKGLNAGKHVVVEKAFVSTSAVAEKMIELAKAKGKVLTVFHNRRYDSDFLTIKHLVDSDALGEVRDAEIHFDIPSPAWISGWTRKDYRPGDMGGMLFGLGTHTIDQALQLFGTPSSVTAFLRSNRGVDSEIDDTFTVILQYSGAQKNLIVTIKTDIITPMKDQLRYFFRGTKGSYIKFGTCPQEANAIAAPGKPATDPKFGVEDEGIWGTLTTTGEYDPKHQKFDEVSKLYTGKYPSLAGWYRGYYENVVDAIRGTGPINVKPETARDGLKVIELARESHEKGATIPWS